MKLKHLCLIAALAATATGLARAAERIDINSASAEMLAEAIRGVGIKKAREIVDYRNANGPFTAIDDLTAVTGIGERTVDLNRDSLQVGGEAGNTEARSQANQPRTRR